MPKMSDHDQMCFAISSLRPGSEWVMDAGLGYASLKWLDPNTTKPTEQEIEAEITRLKAAHELE